MSLISGFGRTAAGYAAGGGGGQCTHENILTWIGDELAYSVTVERHESRVNGSPDLVPFSYRATHLFRRDEDGWRIVLRTPIPSLTSLDQKSLMQWLGAVAGDAVR